MTIYALRQQHFSKKIPFPSKTVTLGPAPHWKPEGGSFATSLPNFYTIREAAPSTP